MEQLDEAGVADNTILMFNSEQGMTLPFGGKWTCYNTGLRPPSSSAGLAT